MHQRLFHLQSQNPIPPPAQSPPDKPSGPNLELAFGEDLKT